MAKTKNYTDTMIVKDRRRLNVNDTVIRFRCTEVEKANLFNQAQLRDITFSDLLRRAVNKYTKKKIFSDLRTLNCIDDRVIINETDGDIEIITEID